MKPEFPNASNDTRKLNPHLFGGQGAGACASPEKQHVRRRQQKQPPVEKGMRKQFRVSVTLRISDERARDIDNATVVLIDCLIAARRQLESYCRVTNPGGESAAGTGGGATHD